MIQTMTNTKKMDDTQRGMKSNKKVHKDLFNMIKFCAAFCCLLLCAVVHVQAQDPPTLVITSASTFTYAPTASSTDDQIQFTVEGGATGWTHSVVYTPAWDTVALFTPSDRQTGTKILVGIRLRGVNVRGERRAVVTFMTEGGSGSPATATVTVIQRARIQPTISVTPSSHTVGSDGGRQENVFTLTVSDLLDSDGPVGWNTSITGDAGVLRLTPDGGGTVTEISSRRFLGIFVNENPTQEERTAVISFFTVVGGNVTVADTATVTVTQAARVGVIPPRVTLVGTGLGAADTVFLGRAEFSTASFSFDVQYGTWTAVPAGFVRLQSSGGGTCSSNVLCSGGTANATKDRGILTATATSSHGGSDRRTASVTITATGLPGSTPVEKVITFIQRGYTTLNITSDLDTLAIDDGSTSTIGFTTNATSWTAMSSESFITLSPTTGAGDATITATAGENTGGFRTATITIIATGLDGTRTRTTTVSQVSAVLIGDPPKLDIASVDTLGHDDASTITIGFATDGTWTAASSEAFVTLSPTSGDSSDALEVTATAASANGTGMLRTATITITSIGLGGITTRRTMVSQEAVPTVRITGPTAGPSVPLPNHMSIRVTNFIFNVGGSAKGWTSNIIYRPAGADFITFSGGAMNPTQTGRVTKTINVSENTGAARTAEIVITTTGSKGTSVSDRLTLTQPAAPRPLVVATNDTTIDHNSGDFAILFELKDTAVGWSAEVTGDPFITLDPAGPNTTATGKVSVIATYGENDTGADRMATITFTTTGDATDMVIITQRADPSTPAAPTISISTTDTTIEANDTSAISVAFTVGGNATGWESTITGDFITLDTAMNANQTGEVTITATPTANTGARRVAKIVITPTGGTGTAVKDSITITQSAETLGISLDESLTLYPNPTDGLFFIESLSGALEVHIHDLLGRQVATYSLSAGERKVDVSALSSGMYVVTLRGKDKTWTEILIIVNG